LTTVTEKKFGQKMHSYSMFDQDARHNERKNIIDVTVKALDADHQYIKTSTEGFLPRMRGLVSYCDAPVVTITFYLHSLLSETFSRDGYRVAFSETGRMNFLRGFAIIIISGWQK